MSEGRSQNQKPISFQHSRKSYWSRNEMYPRMRQIVYGAENPNMSPFEETT